MAKIDAYRVLLVANDCDRTDTRRPEDRLREVIEFAMSRGFHAPDIHPLGAPAAPDGDDGGRRFDRSRGRG